MEGWYCSICEKFLTGTATGGHCHYDTIVTPPTCTAQGYTTFTCSVCGDNYIGNYTPAAHKYSAVITSPTCIHEGYTTHTCSVCGDSYKDTYTDPTGEHTYRDDFCIHCGEQDPDSLYTPGDLTGDGKINSLDGLMLMRHLNGWTLDIASPDAMDVNGDGKVNSLDGLLLMRYLNGWDVTLG